MNFISPPQDMAQPVYKKIALLIENSLSQPGIDYINQYEPDLV